MCKGCGIETTASEILQYGKNRHDDTQDMANLIEIARRNGMISILECMQIVSQKTNKLCRIAGEGKHKTRFFKKKRVKLCRNALINEEEK